MGGLQVKGQGTWGVAAYSVKPPAAARHSAAPELTLSMLHTLSWMQLAAGPATPFLFQQLPAVPTGLLPFPSPFPVLPGSP